RRARSCDPRWENGDSVLGRRHSVLRRWREAGGNHGRDDDDRARSRPDRLSGLGTSCVTFGGRQPALIGSMPERRVQPPKSRSGTRPWWRPWAGVLTGFALTFGAGVLTATLLRSLGHWNNGFLWERELMVRLHAPLPLAADDLVVALTWFGTNLSLIPAIGLVCWW